MNLKLKTWLIRSGPLVLLGVLAVIALLSLGDEVVRQRESRISLNPVVPSVGKDDPSQGAENPTVTIIEFADFTCTACKDQADILKTIINDFGKQVKVVWKDAPLDPLRPEGMQASIAAHCAGRQNKFWEMHDLLFANQTILNRETYLAAAKQLKLNEGQFTECIDKQQTKDMVLRNGETARDAKVMGTPTFYIDGQMHEGLMTYEEFLSAFTGIQ